MLHLAVFIMGIAWLLAFPKARKVVVWFLVLGALFVVPDLLPDLASNHPNLFWVGLTMACGLVLSVREWVDGDGPQNKWKLK